ncbi:MAG: hypothetical protein U0V70_14020 [Terriglobia bacterium]
MHILSGIGFRVYRQNDPKYRRAEFGKSAYYWKSRLRAMGYAWVYSTLFEIGPVSEASIGNVQRDYPEVGFVDHVMTPVLGLGWMMAEDSVDKYVIKKIEAHYRNPYFRAVARSVLNPTRTYANLIGFRPPWERDTRPGVRAYDPQQMVLLAASQRPSESSVAGKSSAFAQPP